MKKMKINAALLLTFIAVCAIYVWSKIPTVMIIVLSIMIAVMAFSAIMDIFKKKINHENKKNKL